MERKKRILLVDDEASFARIMKLNLETNGSYEVRVENQPHKVLATARAFKPDLIFLDVVMPDTDGGQVAAELRSDTVLKNTPIVFLTAIVSKNEVIERGDMIGGEIFLAKPVTMADMIHTIKRFVG